jgi:heat shock protein HtpX
MVLTAVLTPALVVAALVACALTFSWETLLALAVVSFLGVAKILAERRAAPSGRRLVAGEEPALHAIVERLCVLADLPRPELVLESEKQPNSWVVDPPGRPARLHVTRGLLDLLEPAELEAVVAHELSHVANRDATVMTVVGLPGAALLNGGRQMEMWWGPVLVGRALGLAIGGLAGIGSNALSRYRELTADAGAAALTGRPSALASALMKVSGDLARLPSADLRAVAGRDAFHLLPVAPERGWLRVLGPTHPRLERRLAALERLEARLQRDGRALSLD